MAVVEEVQTEMSAVEQAIHDAAQEISSSAADVVLRDEAMEIVSSLREEHPQALLDYLSNIAVSVVRERLQLRLAGIRVAERKSVFGSETPAPLRTPFDKRYAVDGDAWRRVGDMKRSDWRFLIEARQANAVGSLFDIAVAKRIIAKLPDDSTPTSKVLTVKELVALEQQAQKRAEREVEKFSRA